MGRTRAKWPKRCADERRFRIRVRFTRPAGDGTWDQAPLVRWLNERLGRNGWAKYPDTWDDHGPDTYAVHFDDHTAIPELLEFWDRQQLKIRVKPLFQACLGPNVIAAIRDALHALQGMIVDDLNAKEPRVTWAMGTCELLPGVDSTAGMRVRMDQIRRLGEADTLLSTVPAAGERLTVLLEDEQRGAIELGVLKLGDLRPVPTDLIEHLRLLLDALEEVKA